MGGSQAADVLITITNDQRLRMGQPVLSDAEKAFIREPVMANAVSEGNPYYSTANLWDDGIIDPVKTRDVLGLGISAALNGPLRDDVYGYGVFRM